MTVRDTIPAGHTGEGAAMADRRWVAADFGGPEVLKQVDVQVPAPGPGEVTIQVRAVGMNPADFKRFAAGDDRSVLPMPGGEGGAGGSGRVDDRGPPGRDEPARLQAVRRRRRPVGAADAGLLRGRGRDPGD